MAQRDKAAGHAFMYVDIRELLGKKSEIEEASNVGAPVLTAATPTIQVPKSAPQNPAEKEEAVRRIQTNLDRLQSLHHKLHAMLDELNRLTGNKKD